MNKFFADIIKTDDEQRLVYGYASTEAIDVQREIVRKEAIGEALEEYMKFANIREMHQPSAVGIAKSATLDDKGLYISAKVVDDSAWAKVKEGVYKGFSIGGKALQKAEGVISKMRLTEISLVDRPANPECVIDLYKFDGQLNDDGSVDKMDGSTPDLAKYTGEEAMDAARAIACLDAIYTLYAKEASEPDEPAEQVEALAQAIAALKAFIASEIAEPVEEPNPNPMEYSETGGDIGKAWFEIEGETLEKWEAPEGIEQDDATAEGEKLLELESAVDALKAELESKGYVVKRGARNSKEDQDRIQAMHDHSTALGATCGSEKHDHGGNIQKIASDALSAMTRKAEELTDEVAKLTDDHQQAMADIAKLETENESLKKQVAQYEAQPKPTTIMHKPVPVTKAADAGAVEKTELGELDGIENPDDLARAMIKMAHRYGGRQVR